MLRDLPFLSVGVRRGSASSPTPTVSFWEWREEFVGAKVLGVLVRCWFAVVVKAHVMGGVPSYLLGMMPDLPSGGNYLPTSAGVSLNPLCHIRSSSRPFGMSLLVPVPPSSSSSPRAGFWFQSSPTGLEFRLFWEALCSWPLCEIHPAEYLLN